MMGSNAEEIVRLAPVPVLVVRDAEASDAKRGETLSPHKPVTVSLA